ncbi:uncharacterized protein LOC105846624 isoform X6 [Hydra vulgaris]|uniref:Uncharacterized protein LOC105846624 isoform X6 n=1 Tax=Hydra vulgaris TaxID=6087 RepID=A0ABM4D8X2_HYDVU
MEGLNIPGFANISSKVSGSFQQLIKDLGESKTITQTDQIIFQEISYLKKKITEPKLSSQQKENLIRLLYCQMLGHNVSFACMEVVKFTQQKNLIEKRVAYLVLGILLEEKNDVECMMSIGSIQRDLKSTNLLEVSLGLQGACELATRDMLQAIINQVVTLLKHKSEIVRKRAIMVLLKFYEIRPKDIDLSLFSNALLDTDPGVMGVALNAYLLLIYTDCMPYKHLVPVFVSILKQITSGKLHSGFNFNEIPSPWVQIKLLQILAQLGKNDKNCSEKMYPVLNMCLENTSMHAGIGCAVTYECMKTIATVYPDSSLINLASSKAALLLTSQNYNLKYLGVTMLSELVNINMSYASQHQMVVIEFLSDNDETLKRKALDLLYRLTNEHNVKVVCEKLTEYLQNTVDDFIKDNLVIRISTLAERYSPDIEWYIDIMTNILQVGGDSVQKDVVLNMMKIIEKGVDEDDNDEDGSLSDDLRRHAVISYISLLYSGIFLSDTFIQLICWVVGEYFTLVGGYSATELVDKFYELLDFPFKDLVTQCWVVSAIAKLVSIFDDIHIRPVEKIHFKTIDARQRYIEMCNLKTYSKSTISCKCNLKQFDSNLPFLDEFVNSCLQKGVKSYSPHYTSKQKMEVSLENVELIYEHRSVIKKPDSSITEKIKMNEVTKKETKNKKMLNPVKELWTREGYIANKKDSQSPALSNTVISEAIPVSTDSQSASSSQNSSDDSSSKILISTPLVQNFLVDKNKQVLAQQLFGAIGNSALPVAKNKKFQKKVTTNLLEISHEESITKSEIQSSDYIRNQFIDLKTDSVNLLESAMNTSMVISNNIESKNLTTDSVNLFGSTMNTSMATNNNIESKNCDAELKTIYQSISSPMFPIEHSNNHTIDKEEIDYLLPSEPMNSSVNLLDDLVSPNSSFVLGLSLKQKNNLPERYITFKKSVKITELSFDVNMRVTLQYIFTKKDLAVVIEIINKTACKLTSINMTVKLPENLTHTEKPTVFSFEELSGMESHVCVLDVQFQSPSLNMVMTGCLCYRDSSFTEKKQFFDHLFQLTTFLRKTRIDFEIFKEKWNNKTLYDKHERILKELKVENLANWMKIADIYPVHILENEIIGATSVLLSPEILLHFKLTKNHTDLWVKSQSKLLNDMFLKYCITTI